MPNIVATLLLVSAGSLGFGGAPESPGPLKCEPREGGDPDMPAFVLIIDHEPFEGDPAEWNHADSNIYWIEVVCWSWVEEYLGIEVRQGASYVLTRQWLERANESGIASLEALVAAQEHHRQAHGAYAEEAGDLPGLGVLTDYGVAGYMQLDLLRTEAGWGARVEATEKWLAGFRGSEPGHRCYAFVGTPPLAWAEIRDEDRSGLVERRPVCLDPRRADEAGPEGG